MRCFALLLFCAPACAFAASEAVKAESMVPRLLVQSGAETLYCSAALETELFATHPNMNGQQAAETRVVGEINPLYPSNAKMVIHLDNNQIEVVLGTMQRSGEIGYGPTTTFAIARLASDRLIAYAIYSDAMPMHFEVVTLNRITGEAIRTVLAANTYANDGPPSEKSTMFACGSQPFK